MATSAQSRKRAGRHVKRTLRVEIRAALRRNAALLLKLLVVWFAGGSIVVAISWYLGFTHVAAFFGGVFVGLLMLLWQYFLIGQGFSQRQVGGEAEQWTATELAKLDSRVWRVFHDVPLEHGNVDHVVIGPGRVYAVETKWTGSRGNERYLRPGARQAKRQARELAQRLRALGCGRTVIPMLVVWGGGVATALEKPKLWDGTRVVAGHNSDDWLQRMTSATDRLEIDWPVQQALVGMMDAPLANVSPERRE